jgi:hypothetical protein
MNVPKVVEGMHVPRVRTLPKTGPAQRAGSIWVYAIFALAGVVILGALLAESRHP